jgi:hypothetical protein
LDSSSSIDKRSFGYADTEATHPNFNQLGWIMSNIPKCLLDTNITTLAKVYLASATLTVRAPFGFKCDVIVCYAPNNFLFYFSLTSKVILYANLQLSGAYYFSPQNLDHCTALQVVSLGENMANRFQKTNIDTIRTSWYF